MTLRTSPPSATILLVLAIAVACTAPADPDEEVLVLAATSTVDALDSALVAWSRGASVRARASYGPTSALARQLASGAPADIFLSASADWADWVAQRVGVRERGVVAGNRLVVVAPVTSRSEASTANDSTADSPTPDLRALLTSPSLARIGLADPGAVPAGIYARQALETLGLWQPLQPRLVPTLDVRAALSLAARREVDAALVYGSDAAASDAVRIAAELDSSLHEPIVYPVLLLASASGPALRLFDWLVSDAGRAHFEDHGFAPPPDRE